jgi:hypothetical protein
VKGKGNVKNNLPMVEKLGSENRRTHAAALSCTAKLAAASNPARQTSSSSDRKTALLLAAATPTFNPWFLKVLWLPTTVNHIHAVPTQKRLGFGFELIYEKWKVENYSHTFI